MKMTKEIEEFLNLAITEHMGKAYTDWKLKQQTDAEPDKVEEEYEKVIASLSMEQEEAIYIQQWGRNRRILLSVGIKRWDEVEKVYETDP